MSKITKTQETESSHEFFEDDIQDDDYVFVIRADGTLKTVMLPHDEVTFDTPDEVKKILSVYDILDVAELSEPIVLH